MKKSQLKLLPFVTLLGSLACSPDLPKELKKADASASDVTTVPKRDPGIASLTLEKASVEPLSPGSVDKVPALSVNFSNADYYKLLRCDDKAIFTTGLGIDARQNFTELKISELKDVWRRAELECVYVGKKIARQAFQDYTAGHTTREQKFFYVLNPCVANSTSYVESCSHKLAMSPALTYTSTLANDFVNMGISLNELEAKLTAAFYNLRTIAEDTRDAIEHCEDAYFNQKLEEKRKQGMFSILKFGVTALVGGVVTGPAAAFVQSSGVLDGVLGFFKPKINDAPFECKEADQFSVAAIQLAESDIPALMQQVKEARLNMNRVNQGYAKLDLQTIKSNN